MSASGSGEDEKQANGPDEHLRGKPPADTATSAFAGKDGPIVFPSDQRSLGDDAGLPRRIGRFHVRKRLGKGSYGEVFLAYDADLDRQVAVKVPRFDRFISERHIDRYLAEARAAASLRHPGIVSVYDVNYDQPELFIVLEYVEGSDLKQLLRGEERLAPDHAAELMMEIAVAVAHAHEQGLVHRDLKPANVLLDTQGHPHIADFGMAIHERARDLLDGQVAGTPGYMAPEQVRGETHRLDARTDVWSLGIVFYEMLAGKRPFGGVPVQELFHQIEHCEAQRLRHIDRRIPRELERICLKCLSKRMVDRYPTASELADDLRHWKTPATTGTPDAVSPKTIVLRPVQAGTSDLSSGGTDRVPVRVVPKGLRCFDQNDADFYLALLPGPFDRDGLPESIRFWKTRIEQTDSDRTFPVGLLYGPSGCGKSSFLQAGLAPRLADHVHAEYVEATADETEERMLRALKRICPQLPDDCSLARAVMTIRDERLLPAPQKAVLLLDQFEQWLHVHPEEPDEQLVQALRQCDSQTVQCVLSVRDDFGMSVMRFMNALEVPVVEGRNYATVDRFDQRHAARVLAYFGRAFGQLPEEGPLPAEAERFIEQAVASLADDGKVVPVRLALFAEMFRDRPWNPASLKRVGGAEGIGVAFIEETLGSAAENPKRRVHQQACRQVLDALLPEPGRDIRGHLRSYNELLERSGYSKRRRDFGDVLEILDGELRLITPSEPWDADDQSGSWEEQSGRDLADRRYQLTHDYLVPSLRAWLTRKQRETMRGRATLLLESRAELWNARPETRYLPSLMEWLRIGLLSKKPDRTEPQRKMMRSATRRYVAQLFLVACVMIAVLVGGWMTKNRLERRQRTNEAKSLLSQLLVARIERVPAIVDRLAPHRALCWDELTSIARDPARPPGERTRAHLAAVSRDADSVPFLVDALLSSPPQQLRIICDALQCRSEQAAALLWQILRDRETSPDGRVRAAAALARFDPASELWSDVAEPVTASLIREQNPLYASAWIEHLLPVRSVLLEPLSRKCRDASLDDGLRVMATSVLAELGQSHPDFLFAVMRDADQRQFHVLFPAIRRHSEKAIAAMNAELQLSTRETSSVPPPVRRNRVANAALSLARLGQPDMFWPLLGSTAEPDLRSLLIRRLQPYGLAADQLLARLADSNEEPSVRQAILLALGPYDAPELAEPQRAKLVEMCVRPCAADPDASVRAGAEWLLRNWGLAERLVQAAAGREPPTQAAWYLTGQNHTMVVLQGPHVFRMGSPDSEQQRDTIEQLHRRSIPRTFALSAHEVTIEQFLRHRPGFGYAGDVSPDLKCPVGKVSWYDAIRYCRWLSEQEQISEDQMCYPAADKIGPDMELPDDLLERTAYRLPTEAEWEYACRAGTVSSRFFGDDEELLADYAWFVMNCEDRLWPVGLKKPNPFGFFDMYGNVMEWCHDTFADYPVSSQDETIPDEIDPHRVGRSYVFRGGGYRYTPSQIRSAKRFSGTPEKSVSFLGFRVARTMPRDTVRLPQGD